jgi:hypothetical protein
MTPVLASRWLKAAALYNLVWGLVIIAFPFGLFDIAGLPRPNYPEIWQCVGMIVGVYGVGYWIASFDPARHWPVVLVGLLGKVFGPLGFIPALLSGVFNWKFGLTILTNDLLWWIPFFLIVKQGLESDFIRESEGAVPLLPKEPFFLHGRHWIVLVRHSGCTFCRQTLTLLAQHQKAITESGFTISVVHMGAAEDGPRLGQKYQLTRVHWVSDPDRDWYRYFGFRRGSWEQLFGPRVWGRGFVAAVWKGLGVGSLQGDGFQLGGVVVCELGQCHKIHHAADAADVGDWEAMLSSARGSQNQKGKPI